ncbi:F1F0 ATP synthase subunit i [Ascoidea rubescens DSM 1968]|uniref:ATPase, F0 complex, subunit J n=1 Tax=Ascoidea rubescens DSM 1968 TaxID=1344418 RepID=A0A1D2VPL8_9ASCO|nr:ATPase, F0 complex, subunit J [Ascoidea rubescens DSM 1968]ODV63563.1 ATPase, F0 complex, subunit J [Ascoidea rubescens DSM 1968]
MKSFPTPIIKPLWPFMAGGAITFAIISKLANASMNSAEFINDPRHPRFAAGDKTLK